MHACAQRTSRRGWRAKLKIRRGIGRVLVDRAGSVWHGNLELQKACKLSYRRAEAVHVHVVRVHCRLCNHARSQLQVPPRPQIFAFGTSSASTYIHSSTLHWRSPLTSIVLDHSTIPWACWFFKSSAAHSRYLHRMYLPFLILPSQWVAPYPSMNMLVPFHSPRGVRSSGTKKEIPK